MGNGRSKKGGAGTKQPAKTVAEVMAERWGKSEDQVSIGDRIPDWILEKNLTQNERYAWSTGDGAKVVKETEKAYQFANVTDYGTIKVWVPKSVMLSASEVGQALARFELGKAYNTYLLGQAKSAGIKGVKQKMSTLTLTKKMQDAGLTVISKDEFGKLPASVMTWEVKNG